MKILRILLLIPFIWSCLDDKGNYNYRELNKIEFDNISYNYNIYYGDPLDITPKLKFALDSVNVNLQYEWRWLDSTIATTPELHIKEFKYYEGQASTFFLRVTDLSTNMIYSNKFLVSVGGRYQNGWLILGEKNKKSSLSMVRINKTEDKEGNVTKIYSLDTDIYGKVNEGELGSGPIKLHEHFNSEVFSTKGQVLIAQESGSVELDGKDLKKVIETQKEFNGEKYPANFQFKDAAYTYCAGYLLSTDNKLYHRINENGEAFQTGRFFTIPKKDIETGEELNCTHILRTSVGKSKSVLLFEQINKDKGRIIFLSDNQYYPRECGIQQTNFVLEPTAEHKPDFSPFNNIQKELIYWGWKMKDYYNTSIVAILKDKISHDYYIYKFAYEMWNGVTYIPEFEKVFVGNEYITGNSIFKVARNCPYIFFSGGIDNKELYYCEMDEFTTRCNKADISFNAPISAIETDLDGNVVGIGLANGEFYLLPIDNLSKNGIIFHVTSEKNIGRIIDVLYKIGHGYNDNANEELY